MGVGIENTYGAAWCDGANRRMLVWMLSLQHGAAGAGNGPLWRLVAKRSMSLPLKPWLDGVAFIPGVGLCGAWPRCSVG